MQPLATAGPDGICASMPWACAASSRWKARFWEWFGELHDAPRPAEGVHPTRTGILDERVLKVLHYLDRIDLSERIREEASGAAGGLAHTRSLSQLCSGDEVGTYPQALFRRTSEGRLSETPYRLGHPHQGNRHRPGFSCGSPIFPPGSRMDMILAPALPQGEREQKRGAAA